MAICAICVYCDREMTARTGCTVETYECPDGTQWARLPYRPEAYGEWSCHTCAAHVEGHQGARLADEPADTEAHGPIQ